MIRLLAAAIMLAAGLGGCTVTQPEQAPAQAPSGARNVILFLGDGMGVSTVTAARIYAGQLEGKTGEEHVLSFETFPHVALIKTYTTDFQVSDSAGTMTALVTGEKTRSGVLSVGAGVSRGDCAGARANKLPTLLEEAEDRGYATGIISTARITHATPAANFAHVPDRNWEADSNLPETALNAGCRDIARQLVEFDHGDGVDLVLGGGRAQFLPADAPDPEYPDKTGVRGDGANLMREWAAAKPDRHVAWNAEQLALAPSSGQLLGLFEPSHMQFEVDREQDPAGEPSLADMTRMAIERLAGNGNGYFLVVEGGRIDHAHHAGNAFRALSDTVALASAVETALELTDRSDTLILVTADHSHTLTISGYPGRGNPILGKVAVPVAGYLPDADGKPYTTLSYANGPGYRSPRPDLSELDTTVPNFQQPAMVPMPAETHGGEDVAAYATGPNADALRGVMEQNRIYDVLRGALFPD